MTDAAKIDPRLAAALAAQFERWRATLRGGADRVGWNSAWATANALAMRWRLGI